ncbi:MAG: type VI secretion system baseplate subunit TssF, partial [Planctomycetaceae bacterium]|nr:type VI secretion system baseplate subunit TssF [Planctomycetaceae bacterium]
MTDELLPYYRSELQYLKQQAASFAAKHPKIASRLKLDGQHVEDPHIERLLQGVAFLNARIRHKLEDDFPEITEALLSILYPQYLAPVPSMAIAEVCLPEALAELTDGKAIPRGSAIETEPIRGEGAPVRFRTTTDLHLWPIAITTSGLEHRPYDAPEVPAVRHAPALIRVSMNSYAPGVSLGQMKGANGGPPTLRFFLNGQPPFIYEIHEALLTSVIGAAICDPDARSARQFDASHIQPVGFARNELMLPDIPRCFPGYQLLLEYFAFPQKFLFVDITPPEEVWRSLGPRADIFLFLDRPFSDLTASFGDETFRLGCAPIVNLFP